MNNNKYLIVYHLEDNDGVCSAALMKYYLMNDLYAEHIDLFPATYTILDTVASNNFEDFNGYDVLIMLDISFNGFSNMETIYEMFGKNFIWIDHHAPIIKESERTGYDIKINGIRETTKSAILNTYKYCYDVFDIKYNSGKAPEILRYLSAWDSWSTSRENLDFEKTRCVNSGFTSISKLNVDWWYTKMGRILDTNDYRYNDELIDEMYNIGKNIVDEADRRSAELVKNCGIEGFTVNGTRSCIVLFTSGPTNSLMFKSVKGIYDNAVCFKSSSTGNITISMYNIIDNHEFHCGTYLHDNYGGGGHEGAAGATITFEQFTKILMSKNI